MSNEYCDSSEDKYIGQDTLPSVESLGNADSMNKVAEEINKEQEVTDEDIQEVKEVMLTAQNDITEAKLPVPAKQQGESDNNFITPVVQGFLDQAGQLTMTDKELAVCVREIDEDDVEIRPDGLLFPGWYWCANRLNEAFRGQWTMTPLAPPKLFKGIIFQPYALHIKGNFVGYALGEQKYHANNATMTYGDACEGAKSNALLRLCKPILEGMRVLWSKKYGDTWKAKYAEAYLDGQNIKWRKKSADADGSDFYEFLKECGKLKPEIGEKQYRAILNQFGHQKANEVKDKKRRIKILTLMRYGRRDDGI